MEQHVFDPFEDRLSRDIRNDLSEAFAEALNKGSMDPASIVAERYLAQGLAPVYQEYIHGRLIHYQRVMSRIQKEEVGDVFARGLLLWDEELFFEVHEILEHKWLRAEGEEKKILQAMIRAAGVYIKLQQDKTEAARKMADKAVEALTSSRKSVPAIFDLDLLLAKLQALDPTPPKLFRTS